MNCKKGFTLIEVLVVVVVIAIVAIIAFPSYKKANVVSQNEAARGKLLELANAVRMYNEDARGSERVAGDLAGNKVNGFSDPKRLFHGSHTDTSSTALKYLSTTGWNQEGTGCNTAGGDCKYHYRSYTYYVCNPDSGGTQPNAACGSSSDRRIAAMTGPTDSTNYPDAVDEYGGFAWWVSKENLGVVGSNYGTAVAP